MRGESCENCRYFQALDNICRKEPPRCFPMQSGPGNLQTWGFFPPTKASNWCGAYEREVVVQVES